MNFCSITLTASVVCEKIAYEFRNVSVRIHTPRVNKNEKKKKIHIAIVLPNNYLHAPNWDYQK